MNAALSHVGASLAMFIFLLRVPGAVMASERPESLSESAPSWLDSSLFQQALRTASENDEDACVQDVHVSRAIAPGENFSSVIYRAHIKLTRPARECSVLIKTFPDGEAIAKSLKETGLFDLEITMLSKYIPKLETLLDRVAPEQFSPLAPRCLLHGSSPAPYIVLEDLKPQGFRLAERHRGLGLRHSLMALRALARFHSASAALLQQDPDVAHEFTNPMRGDGETWENYFTSGVQLSADVCRQIPGYEGFAVTLERFKESAMDAIAAASDYKPGRFNAILHGDFWTNNMMFKYDDNGDPIDIRIIDFQVSYISSPANDILYFLNTSLSDDVFKNYEQLLIREYHNTLIETLALFELQGPSFKELMADMDTHSAHGILAALNVWPVARAQTVPDLNASLAGESSENKVIYECASTKRWLQNVLPQFQRRGWFKY